ncbi:MAG: hypothetical protein GY820_39505 [Gammaproteobacteria bacterium]|nr:hypothetical protein [Gammaproteobacteria bacterium]
MSEREQREFREFRKILQDTISEFANGDNGLWNSCVKVFWGSYRAEVLLQDGSVIVREA